MSNAKESLELLFHHLPDKHLFPPSGLSLLIYMMEGGLEHIGDIQGFARFPSLGEGWRGGGRSSTKLLYSVTSRILQSNSKALVYSDLFPLLPSRPIQTSCPQSPRSPFFPECLNSQLLLSHSGLCSNPDSQNCYVPPMTTKFS